MISHSRPNPLHPDTTQVFLCLVVLFLFVIANLAVWFCDVAR